MVWQARHFSSRIHTTHTHDGDESDVDEGSEYRQVIMVGCGASVSVTISPYNLLAWRVRVCSRHSHGTLPPTSTQCIQCTHSSAVSIPSHYSEKMDRYIYTIVRSLISTNLHRHFHSHWIVFLALHNPVVQCSAVQCSVVQCSAVQCSV